MSENDNSPVQVYNPQEGASQTNQPIQPSRGGIANYQFSPEEMRVLSECNKESFYQRSLPFGATMGLSVLYAVKRGYLKPSPRFGVYPKMMAAITIGYFMGKLSYQRKCAEKFMRLPNSYIGELLKQQQSGEVQKSPGTSISMFGAAAPDVYSDAGQNSSLDLDTDRPTFSGLEETLKPSLDSSSEGNISEEIKINKSPGMSYDDLRKKNRDDHTAARSQPYRMDVAEQRAPPIVRPRVEQPPKNKYGDVIGE